MTATTSTDAMRASWWRGAPAWERWLYGILGAAALLLVADVVFVTLLFACSPTPYTDRGPLPFTPATWRAGASDPHGSRYLMLADLTARIDLVGMTRTQILDLLGPMQPPGYPMGFGDCHYLGPADRVISVDNDWLVLTFENEVVVGWRIAMD
jgi:hypothetical protein